jgi:predicted CoA-binding protein
MPMLPWMPSSYETFFDHQRYAVVGNSASKPFPLLTYRGLKRRGVTVYPVDPGAEQIDGDPAYPDLASLPGPVDGVIVEVPREQTLAWVERTADAGVKHLWLHQTADTPESLALGRERGLEVRHGTCAVQYVDPSFPHGLHKLVRRVLGRY